MLVTTHLFIPGPTNIPEAVRQAMDIPMEDMRSPDFPNLRCRCSTTSRRSFKNENGRVFIFPSSGTGAWEVGDDQRADPRRQGADEPLRPVLASLGRHGGAPRLRRRLLDVEWGTGVPVEIYAEMLAADKSHKIKAVFATHNETATGVTSDVAAVRAALDAASTPRCSSSMASPRSARSISAGRVGRRLRVSGSQKGFMLPAGLGFLSVSQRRWRPRRPRSMERCYFSFEDMIKNNDIGYFPYTPATQLLRGLRASLDLLQAKASTTSSPATRGSPRACARRSRLGPEALRQGAEMAFRHGQRHPRAGRRRQRRRS